MATTYSGSIDRSPVGNSPSLNCVAGAGGTTTKQPVKLSGTAARTVIACTATDDKVFGIAESTVIEGVDVKIYLSGAIVETDQTLTEGAQVGVDATGVVEDWAANTYVGDVVKAVASASHVKIRIQY